MYKESGALTEVEHPGQVELLADVLRAVNLDAGNEEREILAHTSRFHLDQLLGVVLFLKRQDIEPQSVSDRFSHPFDLGGQAVSFGSQQSLLFEPDHEFFTQTAELPVPCVSLCGEDGVRLAAGGLTST